MIFPLLITNSYVWDVFYSVSYLFLGMLLHGKCTLWCTGQVWQAACALDGITSERTCGPPCFFRSTSAYEISVAWNSMSERYWGERFPFLYTAWASFLRVSRILKFSVVLRENYCIRRNCSFPFLTVVARNYPALVPMFHDEIHYSRNNFYFEEVQ